LVIPLLEPCAEVTIGFAESYESVVADDVFQRRDAVMYSLSDHHKLNSGYETHIILDRKWVVQEISTIPNRFVESQYGRPTNTIGQPATSNQMKSEVMTIEPTDAQKGTSKTTSEQK
jgi:hypothetical protein